MVNLILTKVFLSRWFNKLEVSNKKFFVSNWNFHFFDFIDINSIGKIIYASEILIAFLYFSFQKILKLKDLSIL